MFSFDWKSDFCGLFVTDIVCKNSLSFSTIIIFGSRLLRSLGESLLIWSDHFIRNFSNFSRFPILKLRQISRLVIWPEVRQIFEVEMPKSSLKLNNCSGYSANITVTIQARFSWLKNIWLWFFLLVTILDRDLEYKFWVNPLHSSRCGSVFRNYRETYDGWSEAL